MRSSPSPSRWRLEGPRRLFVLAFVGALLLALAGRGLRFLASTYGPARGACWIWAAGVEPAGEPVAFYAVADLDLEKAEPARIAIAADEGYELHLNGRTVGAGGYRPGVAMDRYRLDGLLHAGSNRITVRLQSLRGPGGFVATVTAVEGERTLAATPAGWRIFREHHPRLFEAGAALAGGEAPQVWQRPPTGRWRLRPAAADLPPWPPPATPPAVRAPRRLRDFYPGARWFDLRRPRKSPIRFLQILLDWGQEVEGRLSLELASPASQPALAYFDAEVPDPSTRPADAVLLFVPGQTRWRDIWPRRFRYVLLVGVEPVDKVWSEELDRQAPSLPVAAGVWGIPPPSRPAELQQSVWQRVQALAEARAEGPQM